MKNTSDLRSTKGETSKKSMNSAIGVHTQDRLYRDSKFRQKHLEEAGKAICSNCSAISTEKHWFIDEQKYQALSKECETRRTLCPGCKRIKDQCHEGEVILESPILMSNKDTIKNLIKNTEQKCWLNNPMSRIAAVTDNGGRLEIRTTTRWLASRIGKEMQKAYKGDLEIKSLPGKRFVRIYWSHS